MAFRHLVPQQSQPSIPRKSTGAGWRRPSVVPRAGLPQKKEKRRAGTAVSLAFHILLLAFLLSPAALLVDPNLKEELLGAGGPGPAGGGGGGSRGTGTIKYVKLEPKPTPVASVTPEIIPPKPVEPVIPNLDLPQLETPKVTVKVQTPIVGIGGGSGSDGSGGNGPGRGGGIGTGIGTGRGSGTGPGTGGGAQANYPPTPTEIFIPPMPMPSSVKGFHLIANFDIDERGRQVGDPIFTPTKDGAYNRKLAEYLKTFKFRPGHTPAGVPIRAPYQMIVDF